MPRQNRVTPYGEIVATPERGLFLGNRGVLHDEGGTVVRHARNRAWIVCVLEFKGRRRQLLQPGRWTELFFLDEATAFAAGHRPCAECRRAAYVDFRDRWREAHGDPGALAPDMDAVLATQRPRPPRLGPRWQAPVAELPDGAFVERDGRPWLLSSGRLHAWTLGGYERSVPAPGGALPGIPPEGTTRVLAHGYRPVLHPSAGAPEARDTR